MTRSSSVPVITGSGSNDPSTVTSISNPTFSISSTTNTVTTANATSISNTQQHVRTDFDANLRSSDVEYVIKNCTNLLVEKLRSDAVGKCSTDTTGTSSDIHFLTNWNHQHNSNYRWNNIRANDCRQYVSDSLWHESNIYADRIRTWYKPHSAWAGHVFRQSAAYFE
jgi:hypothetical protein